MLVRKGIKEDLPHILKLINELADYEKASGEVAVTAAEMENWGFGADKLFECFVVENEENIVGMALYYFKYSTWKGKGLFLEDIIITEKERKKGFGKLLFDEVIKVAREQKVRRMEWQVLEWNAPAIAFYKKYNAEFDSVWLNCKLTEGQLKNM
jgi:L-amino acid N-acyltransferase YncA